MKVKKLLVTILSFAFLAVFFTGCSTSKIKYIGEEETYFYFEYRANQNYDSFGYSVLIAQSPEYITGFSPFSFVTDKLSEFPKLKKGETVGLKVSKTYDITTENGRERITIEKSDLKKIKISGVFDGKEIHFEQSV